MSGTGISFIDMYSPEKVISRLHINTPRTRDGIVVAIAEQLARMAKMPGQPPHTGAGIAVAGQVNHANNTLVFSPNLPFKDEYPLGAELEKATGLKITLENDANAAAIGERVFGAAKGMDDFIVVTLGTGIGSGIFANGKLLRGHTGAGGEAGHIPLLPDGPLCGCGQNGCLEALASGSAISRAFLEKTGETKTAKEVCEMATAGDERAVTALSYAGEWLGAGLVALVNLFNPRAVFFTGSLSAAPPWYFVPALRKVRENSFGASADGLIIEVSKLSADIGVIGAASLPLSP